MTNLTAGLGEHDGFVEIKTELMVHRWILGVVTTIGIGNLFLSFQILSRLPH